MPGIYFFSVDNFSCNGETRTDGSNNNRCFIRQDRNDRFDWTRGTGRTPSGAMFDRRINGVKYPVTGPERAQSGSYYLFVESSNKANDQMGRYVL